MAWLVALVVVAGVIPLSGSASQRANEAMNFVQAVREIVPELSKATQ
jgi:hypothetical protein